MKSPLNKEQRKEWQQRLSLALLKERRCLHLDDGDIIMLYWHKKYVELMQEKVRILTGEKSND